MHAVTHPITKAANCRIEFSLRLTNHANGREGEFLRCLVMRSK